MSPNYRARGKSQTAEAIELLPVVKKRGWGVTLATFAYQIPVGKMVLPGAEKNPHFLKLREMSMIGRKRAHGPIFLAQGDKDTTIPIETVNIAYKRMQDQGTTVEYKQFAGLDHDSVVFGSFRHQIRWVQDRFNGKPLANKKGEK
jgi:hypothetical protein